MCYHGDNLYACDYYNNRQEILTIDFEYVGTI